MAFNPDSLRRVAIVFSGGPAPAANAVISSAAVAFIDSGRDVVGVFGGYADLQRYDPMERPLLPGLHYRRLAEKDVVGIRNQRGIIIGTARANPGKGIEKLADLDDPDKTVRLANVHRALVDLGCDALISIGGDDTLKTANFLYEYQKRLPTNAPRVRIVHLPKTIDNDYKGIDFTFGFFTAVDVMAKELLNLRSDAIATNSWFIVETMGRKAGWLSYGVAVAGEANLVLGVEDIDDGLRGKDGKLDMARLTKRLVDLIIIRETKDRKFYGTVVLAEGLAEHLPEGYLKNVTRDEHGHLSLGKIDLAGVVAQKVKALYKKRKQRDLRAKPLQFGYESRCAPPHAFDVLLGSQLGVGAYRALVEEELDGHMVSVSGQLDLQYVEFKDLINQKTLKTEVRLIKPGSDYHRLARFMESRMDRLSYWDQDLTIH
jgi:ATP-dependent phosphofructokinase / diphosphate-dependent phosphofructokinase